MVPTKWLQLISFWRRNRALCSVSLFQTFSDPAFLAEAVREVIACFVLFWVETWYTKPTDAGVLLAVGPAPAAHSILTVLKAGEKKYFRHF